MKESPQLSNQDENLVNLDEVLTDQELADVHITKILQALSTDGAKSPGKDLLEDLVSLKSKGKNYHYTT